MVSVLRPELHGVTLRVNAQCERVTFLLGLIVSIVSCNRVNLQVVELPWREMNGRPPVIVESKDFFSVCL